MVAEYVAGLQDLPVEEAKLLDCRLGALGGRHDDLVRILLRIEGMPIPRGKMLLRALLSHDVYVNFHSLTTEQLGELLTRQIPDRVVQQAHDHGLASLRKMLHQAPQATPTAKPTGTPTKPPKEPTTRAEDLPAQEASTFTRLFGAQAEYLSCVGVQERLHKAYLRYKRARAGGEAGLDLREMQEVGFLSSPPRCPSAGTFALAGPETVTCSIHGHEDAPWGKQREYRIYFRPWEIARDALDDGRPREALTLSKRFLVKQPNHAWMLETMAEAAMEIENPKQASEALYKLAFNLRRNDPWVLYNAAMAFYESGNILQAREHFQRLLKHASWREAKRRYATRFEFYRMMERARWVSKTFVSPPGGEAVRFFEYKVATDPKHSVEECKENLLHTRSQINQFLVGYYDTPELRKLYGELRKARDSLLELQPFEAEAREEAGRRIGEIEKRIRAARDDEGGTGSVLEDLGRDLEDEGLPSHPGANYRLDRNDDLHCLVHPYLLEDASLVGLQLTEEERREFNVALSKAILANRPILGECFKLQKAFADYFGDAVPAAFQADRVAAALNLETQEAECPAPGPLGGLGIHLRDGKRYLQCRTHGPRDKYFEPVFEVREDLR
jgi:tetratricopeptide (TPR) repeat protein